MAALLATSPVAAYRHDTSTVNQNIRSFVEMLHSFLKKRYQPFLCDFSESGTITGEREKSKKFRIFLL